MLADAAAYDLSTSSDKTWLSGFMRIVGGVNDAVLMPPRGKEGIAVPVKNSSLVGQGAALSVQVKGIGGRNFAAPPTIGCYEVNAADATVTTGAAGQIVEKGTEISRPCVAADITVSSKVGSVRTINIQLRDVDGKPITYVENVQLALYLDAARTAHDQTGGSTGIAIGTNGALLTGRGQEAVHGD